MGENSQKPGVLKRARLAKSKREFSAGGVVYKKEKDKILWLVCKSSPSKKFPGEFWRLPKGWIDDEDGRNYPGPLAKGEQKASKEDIEKAALREVGEEGGVEAKILDRIETVKYFTSSVQGPVLKFATYYLMEWIIDLPEGHDSETSGIAWLTFEKALARLSRDREKEVLKKAKEILERGIQQNLV